MTAESDYPRQLKAGRIAGSVLVLALGIPALGMSHKLNQILSVFDSMVEGGAASLPSLTKFLIQNQIPLMGLISLVMMGTIWGLWMSRRLSTLIYLAGAVSAFFAILTGLIDQGIQQPLITIITKFQG